MTLRVKYYFFRFAFRVTGWGVLPLLVGRGVLCTRRRNGSELIMVIFTRMVNDGYVTYDGKRRLCKYDGVACWAHG